MFFQLLICLFSLLTFASAAPLQPKSGCQSTCGNVSIPYPFGIGVGCYQNSRLALTCDEGNPYFANGCQDIDECSAPKNPCEKTCTNTPGSYYCSCPKGYDDEGEEIEDGVACSPHAKSPVLQLALGVTSISWDDRLRIAAETAHALAYLHSAPIIHRDIKSANILLDDNFTAKVADFGISKLVQLGQIQMATLVQGTVVYLDPEYFNTSQLTEKSDVFSFGVVLVELLTGKKHVCSERPPEERGLATYFNAALKANRLFQLVEPQVIDEGKSAQIMAYSDLAKRCLHMKGEERPTMKEAAAELEGLRRFEMHPWDLQQNEENMSLLSKPQNIYSIELSSYTGDASGQFSMEVMPMNVPPR
ncbi:hypothetical protein GIB67_033793 [Kingdonia uniflora]|uniref:Uncharacterized protein n=1 Tax=Kingdonia uniflora TaxID=39325 RepID=A0A7J7P4B2_9MAGN|nr:hypothetical protein GIB67_033793 [Kingdonia uniflora]